MGYSILEMSCAAAYMYVRSFCSAVIMNGHDIGVSRASSHQRLTMFRCTAAAYLVDIAL